MDVLLDFLEYVVTVEVLPPFTEEITEAAVTVDSALASIVSSWLSIFF